MRHGVKPSEIYDVGVAEIWRLIGERHRRTLVFAVLRSP